jgi:hypothetical protein
VDGAAGSTAGWDVQAIDGELTVSATSSNQFTVRIQSLGPDNTPGPPANFDNSKSYSWPIVTTTNAIAGFDPSVINLLTSDFQGDLGGGVLNLALSTDSQSINLVFTPNQAPVASPATFNRPWDTPLRIDIGDLLARFTGDVDGDARALVQLGSSTNGTAISTDRTSLVFTSTNNLPETIDYWVQDVRPYRPGDTVRLASSSITIEPLPKALNFTAYHAIEIEWAGQAGKTYQLQSRLETEANWTDQGSPLVGTGTTTSLFERTSNVTKFYRIVIVE